MKTSLFAASALLAFAHAAPSAAAIASTELGKIEGLFLKSQVQAFLGIPFAQSPPERFGAPKDVKPWTDTLKVKKVKPSCIQQFSGGPSSVNFTKSIFSNPMPEESEDCLYLNVWVPPGKAPEGGFDVMFWLYGGNLQFGTAGLPMYDGEVLAKKANVILVGTNYRTNVFGFPNSPELPKGEGNPGFLDQRKALKWTHENIKSFGGNPDKVTIFGESAGGWSVKQLIANPPTPPMFRAAIMQSEAAGLSGGAESWVKLATALNCSAPDKALSCVRAASTKSIIDIIGPAAMSFDPIKDDVTCASNITTAFASPKAAKVPFIIGSNAQDGSVFGVIFGGGAEKPGDVPPAVGAGITGITFQCPASALATLAAQNSFPPVYRYYFNVSHPQYAPFGNAGAYHSAEIGLIFGTYPQERTELQKIGDVMQNYWTSFAKDPSKALEGWPKTEAGKEQVLVFDNTEAKVVDATSIDQACPGMMADIAL